MEPQSYATHVHRPVATTVGALFLFVAWIAFALRWFQIGGAYTMALGVGCLSLAVGTLLLISRTYTTRLQDRIIRLEMRLRCGALLTPEQLRLLDSLTLKQLAALRFASDAEVGPLLERAAREQMKPDDIKRAVRNWVADHDRT